MVMDGHLTCGGEYTIHTQMMYCRNISFDELSCIQVLGKFQWYFPPIS